MIEKMRKLPITAAVVHALKSVVTYRRIGLRIGALWMAILFALTGAELLLAGTDETVSAPSAIAQLLAAAVRLLAFSSIAVNWHLFILRDEVPTAATSLRLDAVVLRYLGNSLLALLAGGLPLAVLAAAVAFLPQAAISLLLPAGLAAGAFIMMLSLKLPAVALGRRDFGFSTALKTVEGNFWQIAGVFLLNALVIFGPALIFAAIVLLLRQLNETAASVFALVLSVPLNLFITLFSVSVLTSLYGFFVEKRDF